MYNFTSEVKSSTNMPVTLCKSVGRNLSWLVKPKSEIKYKKKAIKYMADKSDQINNSVHGDAIQVEGIKLGNYNSDS